MRAWSARMALCAGLLAAATTACGARAARKGPRTATASAAAAQQAQDGPPAPSGGLAFPGLDLEWTPPMATAGDARALAAALSLRPEVTLQLGPRLAGAGWQRRAAALVSALAPTTEIAGFESGEVATWLEPGALHSPRREPGSESRPRYTAPALRTTWPEGQVGPRLAIDDAAVRASEWRSLPAVSVGTCEPVLQALAEGQELALVQLGPFLDHADARLAAAYRARLKATVPGLLRALGPDEGGAAGPRQQCERAYRAYLRGHAGCGEGGACRGVPRLVLLGGATIAAPDDGPGIADDCPRLLGRDYVAEVRRVAQEVALSTGAQLSRAWVVLADRLGALAEVYAALDDVCTPRRRRFAAADVAEARRRLARIGAALASDDLGGYGGWQTDDAPLRLAGLGPGRALARFEAGASSVNAGIVADARALRDFVIGRSMCRSGHADAPLAVLLAEPAGGVAFFGYFYEEELFCGALPPLGRE